MFSGLSCGGPTDLVADDNVQTYMRNCDIYNDEFLMRGSESPYPPPSPLPPPPPSPPPSPSPPPPPPQLGIEVRLVNGWGIAANPAGTGTYTMGRLEIRNGPSGVWGTVCDDGFSGVDSQVVCRQLHPSWTVRAERCCAKFGRGHCGSAHVRKSPNRRRATRFLVPAFFAGQKRS